MPQQSKETLRAYCKTIIKENITKIQVIETQLSIVNQLSNLINLLDTAHIGIYYPNQFEINILGLLQLKSDLFFSLPKLIGDEIIYTKYSLGDELTKNKFNLYESTNIQIVYPQLICIPGLGFSMQGHRIGYGKGYFDRYLLKHPKMFKVGICLKEQLLPSLPVNNFDQKLNYIITEE